MMPFALGTREFVGHVCLGSRTTRTVRRVFGRVADIVVRAPIVSSGVFLHSGASIYTGDDTPRITRPTTGVSAIAFWSTHAHVPVAIDFARSAGSFSRATRASACARRAPPTSARPSTNLETASKWTDPPKLRRRHRLPCRSMSTRTTPRRPRGPGARLIAR